MSGGNGNGRPQRVVSVEILANLDTGEVRVNGPTDPDLLLLIMTDASRTVLVERVMAQAKAKQTVVQPAPASVLRVLPKPPGG